MKPVPGICDRCGQRYPLDKLDWEYVLGRRTGNRTCWSCYDESHPQLDTRHVKTNDKQFVPDSRSDIPELPMERRLYAFDPVGGEATGVSVVHVGRVTVELE